MASKVINDSPEMVAVSKLKVHPGNPRKGDLAAIRRSINAHGFYGALVVQASTSRVVVGNRRLEAAKKEGIKEVPVVWVDVDDDVAMRILLADNKIAERATWDFQHLAAILREWDEGGAEVETLGWGDHEVETLLSAEFENAVIKDDEIKDEVEKPPQRRPGADPSKATIVLTKDQYDLLSQVRRVMMADLSEEDELEDSEVVEALCSSWLRSREKKAKAKAR